jgi:dienelactone hydrolase
MRHMRLLVVAALASSLLAFAARPADAGGVRYRDEVFSKTSVTMRDVAYGSAYDHQGKRQVLRLDVHEPSGDRAPVRPAVVWVHGGFFQFGDKAEPYYAPIVESLTRAGYVTVSINYRLNPTTPPGIGDTVLQGRIDEYIDTVRDAQHDAQAAIRWVRAHADELRVDPERVAIVGHSAGGLTTNMVAFNDEDPGTSGNPGWSSRPTAAVAMAGGSLPIKMTKIDPGEPPFQVVHGLVDLVVPAVAFPPSCAATIAMLNVCEMVVDPDQDHGTFGLPQIRDFLYRYVATSPRVRVPVNITPVGLESLTDPASLQRTAENVIATVKGLVPS